MLVARRLALRPTLALAMGLMGTGLLAGCGSSSPSAGCVHACDVEWEACTMTTDRERAACTARCEDRVACRERCTRAHPVERAGCDERHRICISECGG